jgi:hypothetical protein
VWGLILAGVGIVVAVAAAILAWPSTRSAMGERSMQRFRATHHRLMTEHSALDEAAVRESPAPWLLPGLRLLGQPSWLPAAPLGLEDVTLAFRESPRPDGRVAGELTKVTRTESGDTYSSLLARHDLHPGMFDGALYRLTSADASGGGFALGFAESTYFDFLDTSEVLAFEAMRRSEQGQPVLDGPYRQSLGLPWDFGNRVASLGVSTVTIRRDAAGATFFLQLRDGTQVAHNRSRLGVTPAGEFAPSDLTREAVREDLEIWRTVVREYAEEFLGLPEAQLMGGRSIDYEHDTPYGELHRARAEGRLTIRVLGLALEPLTWKPNLLTVCVIDAPVFDEVFREMVASNEEGVLVTGRQKLGIRFDQATVEEYLDDARLTPVAHGCLTLAWRHRDALGIVAG